MDVILEDVRIMRFVFIPLRIIIKVTNHVLILCIINTTNIAQEGIIGLILNFTSAYILSDLDKVLYYAIDK